MNQTLRAILFAFGLRNIVVMSTAHVFHSTFVYVHKRDSNFKEEALISLENKAKDVRTEMYMRRNLRKFIIVKQILYSFKPLAFSLWFVLLKTLELDDI